MPESLCRVVARYVSCGTFAISAIGLQSQQSDCNLSNQTAISAIRLQSQQLDCNLSNQTAISAIRLQSLQSDCNLSNQKKTPPNMPESLCRVVAPYVSCGTFAISTIRLQSQQSVCNLCNQTAISAIRLQSQQSDCNLHNQTAIFTINEQILPCRTYRGPHSRVCQAPSALFQTAISTIRLQSQQSMNRFYPVVHIGVHIPECVKHPAHCLRLQSQQSNCNLSNQTAISAIWLQSQQSDCNLHNQ